MGRIYKIEWVCDKPSCENKENGDSHTMPEGWSQVNFTVNETVEECSCDCHDYDLEDDEHEAGHDEDDCGCPDDDGERVSFFCKSCTMILKTQYFDRRGVPAL